jgi:D(-)-tartrate dehydratase
MSEGRHGRDKPGHDGEGKPSLMSVRITDIREITKPISSPIRNAYIDFTKMTTSLVAVVTDVVRDGKRVVGYGFNSNGRYGQGGLIRERFAPRLLEADPKALLDTTGDNLDPDKVWATMMSNEKPGGHGERSVAVGTIDMAVWDAVAKIAGKPLFRLLAERHKRTANPRVFVYAAGGYYYPGKDLSALRGEMRGYLDRGYNVVKMKIGGAPISEDRERIEAVLKEIGRRSLRSMPTDDSIWRPRSRMQKCCASIRCSGTRRRAIPLTMHCRRRWPNFIRRRWRPAKTCSAARTRKI